MFSLRSVKAARRDVFAPEQQIEGNMSKPESSKPEADKP